MNFYADRRGIQPRAVLEEPHGDNGGRVGPFDVHDEENAQAGVGRNAADAGTANALVCLAMNDRD